MTLWQPPVPTSLGAPGPLSPVGRAEVLTGDGTRQRVAGVGWVLVKGLMAGVGPAGLTLRQVCWVSGLLLPLSLLPKALWMSLLSFARHLGTHSLLFCLVSWPWSLWLLPSHPLALPCQVGGTELLTHQRHPSLAGHSRDQGISGPPGQACLAAGTLCVSPLGPRGSIAQLPGWQEEGGCPALLLTCCWRCSEPCWYQTGPFGPVAGKLVSQPGVPSCRSPAASRTVRCSSGGHTVRGCSPVGAMAAEAGDTVVTAAFLRRCHRAGRCRRGLPAALPGTGRELPAHRCTRALLELNFLWAAGSSGQILQQRRPHGPWVLSSGSHSGGGW